MAHLGPVCISFSKIGNRKGTADPAYETHRQYYKKMKTLCEVLIIENVPEYGETHMYLNMEKPTSEMSLDQNGE